MTVKKSKELTYNDEHVSSLNQVEAMRFRPTVIIGETGLHGVMHLAKETLTNSVDEALNGFGDVITLTIDTKIPRFTVEDHGRGIPLGKLVDSVSVMNTSGKYGDISGKGSGGYNGSGGLNGVGLKAVNFISRNFIATSRRDGERDAGRCPCPSGRRS